MLGFVLRLYKIDIPLADHHSWRQADTAAVARNFIKTGFDFFKPQIDNFIPLHLGVPNKERLFLVEPPIYNSLVAGVYSILGVDIKWARMVSILFSLGSAFLLYLISKRFFGEKVGLKGYACLVWSTTEILLICALCFVIWNHILFDVEMDGAEMVPVILLKPAVVALKPAVDLRKFPMVVVLFLYMTILKPSAVVATELL